MSRNIWFCADLHLGHKNILKLCNRPFKTIEEHDSYIINRYNELISDDTTIYILGDICWNQSYENYKNIFTQLKGKKYVVLGNHDNKQNLIRCKKDGLICDLFENKTIQIDNIRIFLAHFPYREWNGFYKGAYHFYGHCHGILDDFYQSTDVGIDCWEYEPVSFEEVKEYIDNNCEPNVVE